MTRADAISRLSPDDRVVDRARQLALLGIVLQALHVLFGVTAIIGVLVTQTRIRSTVGTVYYSQLRWQFVTFWIALCGYAIGLYLWLNANLMSGILTTFVVVLYRILVNVWHWKRATAIQRFL
jgi:uncharacterized membrane protein